MTGEQKKIKKKEDEAERRRAKEFRMIDFSD
jgi:hypothetical protein